MTVQDLLNSSFGAVRRPALRQVAAVCAVAALLAGCQTINSLNADDTKNASPLQRSFTEAEIQSQVEGNVVAKAAYWGGLYEQDPRNAQAAAEYASALRAIGSTPAALDVLRRAGSINPDDPRLLAEYAKTLTASGRASEALTVFEKALAADPHNWRTLTAQGVALDQLQRPDAARTAYRAAIKAAPGEPAPWNNLGLSYALTGDLAEAELAMRKAVSTARATAKMRQNLAMVLGLRGDYTEAERLSRAQTAPAAVDGDAETLRAIVSQPALWAREANADNNPVIIE